MSESVARWLLMGEVKAKRQHQRRIQEAGEKRECIIEGCERPMSCRGLCQHHANKFFSRKRSMSRAEWLEFERRCIEEGVALPTSEQRKFFRRDVFSALEAS